MFIDIHCHKLYLDGTIFVFSQALGRDEAPPEGTLFSAGVHPWAAEMTRVGKWVNYFETSNLSAVGEIGLDYAADVSRTKQQKVFEQQLEIAEQLRLPVIIHCVRAFNDVFATLRKYDLPAVIFHGFIGSPEQAAALWAEGYYMSFGVRSIHSPRTVEALKIAPVTSIFAETDDKTWHVGGVYFKIAELKGMTIEDLQIAVAQNFNEIFQC